MIFSCIIYQNFICNVFHNFSSKTKPQPIHRSSLCTKELKYLPLNQKASDRRKTIAMKPSRSVFV